MKHVLQCTGHELVLKDIVRAQGCFLYDCHGKRYMDLESGVWVTPLGHSHPGINRAIRNQLEKIIHAGYCYSSAIVGEASRALLDITGLERGKCVFLSSGSEAVEFGVKVLRKITGKPKLLCLNDSFLGSYGSAGEKKPGEWFLLDWSGCRACKGAPQCDINCDTISAIPFQDLGGFVFEPGSASGLVRFPPRALIRNLVELVREHGGRVQVNEVTTGTGRTGQWFGFQHYDFLPDLVSTGKGLGNGYPVSAIALSRETLEELDRSGFYYQQSHQNDPLGCRVALEVINVIRDNNLIEQCREMGRHLISRLKLVCREYPFVREVRGRGLMIAIEFCESTPGAAASAYRELLQGGFIVSLRQGRNALRVDPPLIVEQYHLDLFLVELARVLQKISINDSGWAPEYPCTINSAANGDINHGER